MSLYKWSKTASNNATADATINWAEGQAPSSVNDSARAMMAAVAKYRDDIAGALTTGGTSTAYTLTTNQSFGSLANLNGARLTFVPHTTNGANPTLAVDGLAAKPINFSSGVAVPAGYLKQGTPYGVTYSNTNNEFVLHGTTDAAPSTKFPDGASSAPSISFSNDTDTGIYRIGADNLGVAANGAKVLDIGTGGLGVTGTLSVSSTATITGALTASNGLTVSTGGLTVSAGSVSFPDGSISGAALSPNIFSVEFRTSSATITIPSGATRLRVTLVGGGGGGGGASNTGGGGGGGGGGATCIKYLTGLTPGNTLSLTVGAAGSGGSSAGTAGGTGGNTTLSSGTQTITTLTAAGGGGGNAASGTGGASGNGGSATNGDLNISGGKGFAAVIDSGGTPNGLGISQGGGSMYAAPVTNRTTGSSSGDNAVGYGGGGAGGVSLGGAGAAGGAGSQGLAIFEWLP
jgi:hypothetical protein